MVRKILISTLLLALFITGCAPASKPTEAPVPVSTEAPATEASSAIVLSDGLDREVKLDSPAQKIVSLAPSNTEILFAVGAGAQVIARDDFSDYPEEAKALPGVGGSMGEFNIEAIVALEPDLVLASELNTPEFIKSLEDLGITVYYVGNPKTFEEMYQLLEIVAQLSGHEEEAQTLVESLQGRVKAVDEKIMPLSSRPTVFYELDATDSNKPWTSGPGTFVDLLINRAGGFNVGASLDGEWAQISSEALIAANPQVILLGDALYGVTVESVAARPGWDAMLAVQSNAIFPFNPDTATRPGPRLVDALEELAKLLHGGAFQ